MTGKNFSSMREELEHYKAKTAALEEALQETQSAMEEFQVTSRELEEDLERELDQSEKRYKELKSKNEMLKDEVEEWKQKYDQSNINQTQMQKELDSLKTLQEKFVSKTRELEIDYDDLERTERATKCSLIDMENKYNKAIERNVIMENELEEKKNLIIEVQRLKDELKDVSIELAVLKNKQDELGPPAPSSEPIKIHHSPPPSPQAQPKQIPSKASKTTPPPKAPRVNSKTEKYTDQLDSSSTVKMVQEMVGRVKSIEARLVSCRSLVTPLLAPPPSYSTTMPLATNSPPQSPKVPIYHHRSPIKGGITNRRPSIQKSKAFPMSPQMRANAMSKVQ